jgi:hypothetical protein
MKIVVLFVALAAAFWAGYDLCAYRAYGAILPTLSQSRDVSTASLMIKFVDRIDKGDTAALRGKLLAIAKVTTENPNSQPGYSFRSGLLGPLESTADITKSIRAATEAELVTVHADIARLCQTSPETDTYRYVCSR